MKYIMIQVKIGGMERLMPVIFPESLTHSIMAECVLKGEELKGGKVVSAGDCKITATTSGRSSTLKMKAKATDADVINMHDYFHGITE
jgi:hypothetical protein